jgi:minor histocompatibility antigen H13
VSSSYFVAINIRRRVVEFSQFAMDNPSPVMEILGRIAFEAVRMRPLLPTYFHLLVSVIFPIYTGAHASLSRPPSAALPERKKASKVEGDDEDEEVVVQKMEGLSPSDAIAFPLLAGTTLASLYFLLKWLKDPAILNKILGYYFAQIGLVFGIKFLKDASSVARSVSWPTQYSANGGLWKANNAGKYYEASSTSSSQNGVHQPSPLPGLFRSIPLPRSLSSGIWRFREAIYTKASLRLHLHKIITFKSPIDLLDLASMIVTTALVIYHTFVSKPWWLTNFMGFSFCYGSLQFISPTTAWTGTLILSALFFYDIYFVFFTPMMITVATKLDVPIKLLFPRPDGCVVPVGAAEGSQLMEEYLECLARKRTMAMIGLGDIIIPGMMIAFALRYDLFLFYLRQQKRAIKEGKEAPGCDVSEYPNHMTQRAKYLTATGGWGERFWTNRKLEPAELKAKRFPKTYFHASLFGYVLGMVATLIVMQVAEHAQPALLYLVPGVLTSLWSTAFIKGDLKLLWEYNDAWEEDQDKDERTENKRLEKDNSASLDSKSEFTKLSKADAEGEARDKAKKGSKTKEACRDLVSFSITLPPVKLEALQDKREPTSESDKITSELAEAMNDKVSGSVHTNRNAVAPLPDVEADNAVIAKLESTLTGEVVDGGGDRQPPEKRRRKA